MSETVEERKESICGCCWMSSACMYGGDNRSPGSDQERPRYFYTPCSFLVLDKILEAASHDYLSRVQ